MSWADPGLLALFAVLVVVLALRAWWTRAIRRAQAGSGAGHPVHAATVGRGRGRLRAGLLALGVALAVAALAGPRWGVDLRERTGTGADVMVLLDCSRSMRAADLVPDRMEAARRKTADLLRIAPHLRLGLMPFAAVPVLRCPPTGDQQVLGELLRDCGPELFPAEEGLQGTGIGVAVQEALRVLGRSREPGQAVLVVSDGADPDTAAVAAAATAARAAGVPVFGLLVGDLERPASLTIDGEVRPMVVDRSTIDALAVATGAAWFGTTLDDADVRALAAAIDRGVASAGWRERQRTVAAERYRWLLIPAILASAAGLLVPMRRRS